jgi:hypothetical protein
MEHMVILSIVFYDHIQIEELINTVVQLKIGVDFVWSWLILRLNIFLHNVLALKYLQLQD